MRRSPSTGLGQTPGVIATVVIGLTVLGAVTTTVPYSQTQAPPTMLLAVRDPARMDHAAADVRAAGGVVVKSFEVASAMLVRLPTGAGTPLGTLVVPDVSYTFDQVSTQADASPYTVRGTLGVGGVEAGAGVTVAVVDTGVADVPDLAGRLTHVNVSGGPDGDGVGHGTFLAGLAAGTATGVAPQASVVDVKVALPDGTTSLSSVLSGLQYVADHPSARVVSLALSTGSPLPPSSDPLAVALDTLWSRGVTVVVSAGNDGPAEGTVASPGNDPLLLTAGSIDDARTSARTDDLVASFSGRDKSRGVVKPDVVAPGVSLVSLRAPGSLADLANPGSAIGDDYFRGSGTSMSTAVVAGAVANLLSARPSLAPTDVKTLLMSTAYEVAGEGAGAGAVDLAAAILAPVPRPRKVRLDDVLYGPAEADAETWERFAAAWAGNDLPGVRDAWIALSEQTRRWAGTAWAMAVVGDAVLLPGSEYEALTTDARRWATQNWASRSWSTDRWVSRSWSTADWMSRSWSSDDWLASAWSSRSWSSSYWASRSWSSRSWSSRSWSDAEWATFCYTSRSWSSRSWSSQRWTVQHW